MPARAPNTPDDPTPPRIEFCLRNVDHETRERLLALGPHVHACGCLTRCSRCVDHPFLLVDGEPVEGPSHKAILRRVLGPEPHA